jgi:HEPN domain-containing protein
MDDPVEHLENGRRELSDFRILAENGGSAEGMVEHAHLAVEHGLKALALMENGGNRIKGHQLGALLHRLDTDVSQFEQFILDMDGMYTNARYDWWFETEMMHSPADVAHMIEKFLSYVNDHLLAHERS